MTEDIRTAILRELVAAGGAPDVPINLLVVGPNLVGAGFDQLDIVDALYSMESNGVLHMISGNRVVLLKPPAR